MRTELCYDGYFIYHLVDSVSDSSLYTSWSDDQDETLDLFVQDLERYKVMQRDSLRSGSLTSRNLEPLHYTFSSKGHSLETTTPLPLSNKYRKESQRFRSYTYDLDVFTSRQRGFGSSRTARRSKNRHSVPFSRETILIFQGGLTKQQSLAPATSFDVTPVYHDSSTKLYSNVATQMTDTIKSSLSIPSKEMLPDATFCWRNKSNEPLKCFVQIPSLNQKKDISEALALWIVDRLSNSPSTCAELNWVRRVHNIQDTAQVEVDLDDHPDVLHILFHDNATKTLFQEYAQKTSDAVVLTDQYPLLKKSGLTSTYSPDKHTLNFRNEMEKTVASIPLSPENNVEAIRDALHLLQQNPIRRLPSMDSESLNNIEGLVRFLQHVVPEGYWLANHSQFSIIPFGSPKTDTSQIIGVRLVIAQHAGVALQILEKFQQKIPVKIKKMFSFDPVLSLIDISAVLRCVPIDTQTFIVTLKNDENSRLLVTKFKSLLQRWAIGDILDSISYYGNLCNYKCSITTHEVRLLNLVQRYLSMLNDTPENEDEFHLHVDCESPSTKFPLSVVLRDHQLVWKEKGNKQDKVLDPPTLGVESYQRPDESSVLVTVQNLPESLKLIFLKPKLQCYFGEYLQGMQRRKIFITPSRIPQELQGSMENASALISHLLEVCREHCLTLARLSIQVELEGDTTLIPAHFNLICTRIVADRVIGEKFTSIDLRYITSDETLSDNKELICVEPPPYTPDDDTVKSYILHFPAITELFSFKRFCRQICSFQQRTCNFVIKELQGDTVVKPGARVNNFNRISQF